MHTGGRSPLPSPAAEVFDAGASGRALTLLPWVPLLTGLANSYGPVALNYGFALYFLNYRHGFVKRGLIGTLMEPIPFLT